MFYNAHDLFLCSTEDGRTYPDQQNLANSGEKLVFDDYLD
jgi:hypothetical protein